MQAAAARRAFSSLAAKIHPPLPLTPRESQQLLNLLTTSFRTHLDREFAAGPSEGRVRSSTPHLARIEQGTRAPSSYDSASEHIDSILSNPLFARKPRRRPSESVAADALRDPLSWFLDQVALGTADLSKASLCLDVLQRSQNSDDGCGVSVSSGDARPASIIAEWLRTSGQETSKEFLIRRPTAYALPTRSLVHRLVPMLLAEGNQAPLWRWYTYDPEQDTALTKAQVAPFKVQLLKDMINAARTRDEAFTIFLQAYKIMKASEDRSELQSLQVAGGRLVDLIVANAHVPCTLELYESFALSTRGWLLAWNPVVEAMLCLNHPTQPDPQPGLALIKDPTTTIGLTKGKKSRQKFLVRMCLGVAQQLIKEARISDAHIAMAFTKEHFAELVLAKQQSTAQHLKAQAKKREEKRNIELLDRLLLT